MFIIDAGKPGPEYQPGHAHCDLLSFELYTNGKPWIVDPGVHGYAGDEYRAYCRSTAAHNTLSIGGREQSELWGSFRVARQARLMSADAPALLDGHWQFRASYTPYFNARVLHERQAERMQKGTWMIKDRVSGETGGRISGALHFHPEVEVSAEGDQLVCRRGSDVLVVSGQGVSPWRLERGQSSPQSGWFFPAFGHARRCTTVRYDLQGAESRLTMEVREGT
jgi:uncharacterized heparinase superfamily protein